MDTFPSLAEVRATAEQLSSHIRRTPVLDVPAKQAPSLIGMETPLNFKLELFQATGTFKVRGALNSVLQLAPEQRARGLTAVSAGNHAVAVAYAARALRASAKVVMIKTANPLRVELAKSFGAEVEMAEDGQSAFRRAQELEAQEGRYFVHPFEGRQIICGSATVGLEWYVQAGGTLDAIVVAVGGGGLIGGVALAMKQLDSRIKVYGVEPEGAAVMLQSLQAGKALSLPTVASIADSLAPPMTTPYTFAVCREYVDRIVTVSDAQILQAMQISFRELKLAVEPAGAAALAAAAGPLRDVLRGQRVGILVCGANIDSATFCAYLSRAGSEAAATSNSR